MSENTTDLLLPVIQGSGLNEEKQLAIKGSLDTFFVKLGEWKKTIGDIEIKDETETGKMRIAREIRLTLKDTRLEALEIVKTKRAELKEKMAVDLAEDKLWLKAGQMIETEFKSLELTAKEKEDFIELLAIARRNELKQIREAMLIPYMEFVPQGLDFGSMEEENFQKVLTNGKVLLAAQIEEKRVAEERRIENERLDKQEHSRKLQVAVFARFLTGDENLREMDDSEFAELLESLVTKQTEYDAEQEKLREENERLKEEAKKRAEAEAEKLAEEKKKQEIADALREQEKLEAQKKQKEQDDLLRKEREEKEKLEKILKAQKDAEIEAQRKAGEEAKKLAKAPIKEQLNSWVDSFDLPHITSEAIGDTSAVKEIFTKFEAFKKWAKTEIDKI